MSSNKLVAAVPLLVGFVLVSIAILVSLEGAFMLEWMGAFLTFYGLSTLKGTKISIILSALVLVAGSIGDILLLGGLTPVNWTMANYMVFIHSAAGTLTSHIVTRN